MLRFSEVPFTIGGSVSVGTFPSSLHVFLLFLEDPFDEPWNVVKSSEHETREEKSLYAASDCGVVGIAERSSMMSFHAESAAADTSGAFDALTLCP
jgi:hypothetical protein